MSVIKDILYGVLIEDWYYGLVLNLILMCSLMVTVEKIYDHLGLGPSIIALIAVILLIAFYIINVFPYSLILALGTGVLALYLLYFIIKVVMEEEKRKTKN